MSTKTNPFAEKAKKRKEVTTPEVTLEEWLESITEIAKVYTEVTKEHAHAMRFAFSMLPEVKEVNSFRENVKVAIKSWANKL